MDVLLSVLVSTISQGRPASRARCRRSSGRLTTDGYVPDGSGDSRRWSDTFPADSRAAPRGDSVISREESVDSFASLVGKAGMQLAVMALTSYVSMTALQYALQGKDRDAQKAARSLLKAKLPGRRDIDFDGLGLSAHEIALTTVSRPAVWCVALNLFLYLSPLFPSQTTSL